VKSKAKKKGIYKRGPLGGENKRAKEFLYPYIIYKKDRPKLYNIGSAYKIKKKGPAIY